MADLPDLNTDNIGYIAYWNAINDGGATSIDAEDVLTDGSINSYTLYDNGVEIDSYSAGNGRNIEARVKNDGWLVAWIPWTFERGTDIDYIPDGWYDLARNWTSPISNSSFANHILERAINSLQNNLSNSDGISYSASDVGLYSYEYEDSAATTGMSVKAIGTNKTAGFSYTDNTQLFEAVSLGATAENWATTDDYHDVQFESTTVAYSPDDGSDSWGAYDLIANDRITSANTEYQMNLYDDGGYADNGSGSHGTLMMVWG